MNDRETVAAEVRSLREFLTTSGWIQANAVGELCTVDHRLWLTSVYVHGEYTVEASYRSRGYGRPEGVARVRLTPAMVRAHNKIGMGLAMGLVRMEGDLRAAMGRGEAADEYLATEWPPDVWGSYTR